MEIIVGDDVLLRRIVHFHVIEVGQSKRRRISSAAFKPNRKPEEISVDLGRLTTPEKTLERSGKPLLGVVSLKAQVPLALGMEVKHDPNPPDDPDNEAHTLIIGENTKSRRDALASAAEISILPGAKVADS
ncbi:MAG TPA: hypothetical protein VFS30_13330 [Dehalococcoidia bacterium]|nr:hypothetical protein [Dehalococcoidia bacterium]